MVDLRLLYQHFMMAVMMQGVLPMTLGTSIHQYITSIHQNMIYNLICIHTHHEPSIIIVKPLERYMFYSFSRFFPWLPCIVGSKTRRSFRMTKSSRSSSMTTFGLQPAGWVQNPGVFAGIWI